MSINGINAISGAYSLSSEHLRIMEELVSLGVRPTGALGIDRMKLQQAKATKKAQDEATPLNEKPNENMPKIASAKDISLKDDSQIQKEQAMSTMKGASNLAELNKKMFGL